MEGNHESKNEEKTFFYVLLLIHDQLLNPQTTKDACLRFLNMIWFLQFLGQFLFLIEARNIFIWFYTEFWENQ